MSRTSPAVGALTEFIDGFLLINARYNIPNPLTSFLAKNWSALQEGFGVSLWVIVVGLGALAILSLSGLRRENRRQEPAATTVAAFGAAGLVGLAWTLHEFDSWPDAFLLLPLAALGIGGMTKALIDRVSPRAALSLTLTWAVAAVGVAVSWSVTERDHSLDLQRRSVTAMLEHLPADASLLAINSPQALVLSGKTNPTRHQTFASGLDVYVDDIWPGGLSGFGEWIGREQPTIITVAHQVLPWLAETIETEYVRVGRAPGWVWYVHRCERRDGLSAVRRDSAHPGVGKNAGVNGRCGT